jgi:hypothetical protein
METSTVMPRVSLLRLQRLMRLTKIVESLNPPIAGVSAEFRFWRHAGLFVGHDRRQSPLDRMSWAILQMIDPLDWMLVERSSAVAVSNVAGAEVSIARFRSRSGIGGLYDA